MWEFQSTELADGISGGPTVITPLTRSLGTRTLGECTFPSRAREQGGPLLGFSYRERPGNGRLGLDQRCHVLAQFSVCSLPVPGGNRDPCRGGDAQ